MAFRLWIRFTVWMLATGRFDRPEGEDLRLAREHIAKAKDALTTLEKMNDDETDA